YDGQPMRVGVFEGRTVVYSVGKDGRDDGGRSDSEYDQLLGDLIYRVPEGGSHSRRWHAPKEASSREPPSGTGGGLTIWRGRESRLRGMAPVARPGPGPRDRSASR